MVVDVVIGAAAVYERGLRLGIGSDKSASKIISWIEGQRSRPGQSERPKAENPARSMRHQRGRGLVYVGLDSGPACGREVQLSIASIPVTQIGAEQATESVAITDQNAARIGCMLYDSIVIGILGEKARALHAHFIWRQFLSHGCRGEQQRREQPCDQYLRSYHIPSPS